MLSEDNRVKLVSFSDVSQSEYTDACSQRWLQALLASGQCATRYPAGLSAADYNLASAQLTLITPALTQDPA